jgi:D-alanine-D-alanine ligase
MLEEWAGGLLEPVEYEVRAGEHNIMGREVKGADQPDRVVKTHCPARLDDEERREVMSMAAAAFRVMKTADFGRIDLRLDDRGRAYVIEINPLPGLRRDSPVVVSAEACGLSYEEVCGHILTSAVKRYGLERTGPRGTR